VSLVTRDFSSTVRISGERWRARRAAVVRRRLRQFGSGDWPSVFTGIGPNRDLIGTGVGSVRTAGSERATLLLTRFFRSVRRRSGMVPTQVAGRIHASDGAHERDIAVAVNGRIEAVGRSFHLLGEDVESYAVMVPEASLEEGRNRIEVLEVTGDSLELLAAA
jgi:hypothetical protein